MIALSENPTTSCKEGRDVASPDRDNTVLSVGESFIDLQRTVRRSKARLLAAGDDVDSVTYTLLRTIESSGPMRTSALAAELQTDLSTVSRQVASLIGRTLLERRADQLDGRASLLALTDEGRALLAVRAQDRQAFFNDMLSDWDLDELDQFAAQLSRFAADYGRTHAAWLAKRGAGRTHESHVSAATDSKESATA